MVIPPFHLRIACWKYPLLPLLYLVLNLTPVDAQVVSESLRPPAMGKSGMVATAHPLASLAGQKVLADGGNAVDAIVAAAAALNAVEPYMSGIGGVGYMLLYSVEEKRVRSLVFGGWVPKSFNAEEMAKAMTFDDGAGHGTVEAIGPMTAAVPGNLAGWNRALEDYGTMSLARVLEPAIEYLEHGVPVTEFDQAMWEGSQNRLVHHASSKEAYLKEGNAPYRIGEIFANPKLAATMRQIGDQGIDHFYRGALAQAITDAFAKDGGFISREDLAKVPESVKWTDPLMIDYKGYTIYNHPPPGMGIQQLQTLKIMEGFDIQEIGHNSTSYLAHLMETIALCRHDTDRYIGDPAYVDIPLDLLLSDEYIGQQRVIVQESVQERQKLADNLSPSLPIEHTTKEPLDERYTYATTSLSAADQWGNVVVITQTLGGGFGSGYVAGETGIAFNNAMEWMDMKPDSPNTVEPGKAVGWCIGAMMQVHKDGIPVMAIGSPGSFGILQSVPQVTLNVLDFGMDIQAAIDAPRFRWKDELGAVPAKEIIIETRVEKETRKELERLGFVLDSSPGDWTMFVGGAQGIFFDRESGWILGGADPRRNGYALGW